MKTIYNSFFTAILFLLIYTAVYSQDVIIKKNNEEIKCKITEIEINTIKYKMTNVPDGPIVTIRKRDVRKIIYENGEEVLLLPDEMDVNQEYEILDKKQVVKFEFFSPLANHLGFGYERVLKVGTNLETKIGIIGLGINNTQYSYDVFGGYFKVGGKFLLGNDFYIEGMQYAHPLRGSYAKIEVDLSSYRKNDMSFTYYNSTTYSAISDKTDIVSFGGAVNLIYGKQYILGNMFTLDGYFGIGYGFGNSYATNSNYDDQYLGRNPTNYYSHIYFGNTFPLTMTYGMTLGYIFK